MKKFILGAFIGIIIVGCTASPFTDESGAINEKTKKAVQGAVVGGAVGSLINDKATTSGAIIGAVAGANYGKYKDGQKKELKNK